MFEVPPVPIYQGMTMFEGPPPPIYPPMESCVIYPRRMDRIHARPCAMNAQGLFPPNACLFVGNLSTQVPRHQLARDLEARFAAFGNCHVKIKYDKKNRLPTAFLQFERAQDAESALRYDNAPVLHGRVLRIERAKARRTASLGHRNGFPMTEADICETLHDRGPLEAFRIEPVLFHGYYPTQVATVTFAYIDDCIDAIKILEHSFKYFMQLLPLDGSPLLAWAPPTFFLPPPPPSFPPFQYPMMPQASQDSYAAFESGYKSGSRDTVPPPAVNDGDITQADTASQSTIKVGEKSTQEVEQAKQNEDHSAQKDKQTPTTQTDEQDTNSSSNVTLESRSRSSSKSTEATPPLARSAESNKTDIQSPSPDEDGTAASQNDEQTPQEDDQSTLREQFRQSLNLGSTIIPKIRGWVYQEMLERDIELSAESIEEVIRDLEEEQRIKEAKRTEKQAAKQNKRKS